MHTIAQLFAAKAAPMESVLGKPLSEVILDNSKNHHYQLFEHGVIIAKVNAKKTSHLTCTYGQLFHAWWDNSEAEWLGNPLEDLYETTNFKWDPTKQMQIDGDQIMVQRFERGVIWCRSDGSAGTQWLSWRDWHAISRPSSNNNKAP